jgi:hypothetical protein
MGRRGRDYFLTHFEQKMLLERLEALMQKIKGE